MRVSAPAPVEPQHRHAAAGGEGAARGAALRASRSVSLGNFETSKASKVNMHAAAGCEGAARGENSAESEPQRQ